MFHGVATLMARSLRMEANWLRTHLYRAVFAGIIYFMMLIAQVQALTGVGAPGLSFFSSMLFLNAVFITFGGIGFFATAITEEKEEDTIGLLMMAGISPVSLLLGKSTSRLLQGLLLLAVQFPFTLLAITLGGILMNQVLAAYASLLAFTVLFANVGLLASTICKRSGTAMGWMVVFLLVYSILPPFVPRIAAWLSSFGWLSWVGSAYAAELVDWLHNASVWSRLVKIQSTGFAEAIFGAQVVTNLVGALVCFLTSWAVFRRFALSDDHAAVSRGLLQRGKGRWRWLGAGRAWSNPLIWKEYYFLTGGDAYMVVKLVGYACLWPLIGLLGWLTEPQYDFDYEAITRVHVFVVLGLLILEAAVSASRLFHDEIRGQTMVSLLTLPRSITYISYSKLAGCAIGVTPGLLWLGVDAAVLPEGPQVALESIGHPALWGSLLVVSVFLHLTVLLSLFVKWGALPLAFCVTLVSNYCCPLLWMPFVFLSMSDDAASVLALMTGILWIMHIVTAFVFQMMIHARLYELGTK